MSENVPPARQQPFAIMVLDETEITATVMAKTEMTRMWMMTQNKIQQLAEQTWREELTDDEGNVIRVVIHDNPNLKWWFDQSRKILTDMAKMDQQNESEHVARKTNLMASFLNSENVPPELREQFVKYALKRKLGEAAAKEIIDAEEAPIKNKDREW